MLGLGAVSVWRLLRAGRVGIRFVLRCVFVADLTVLFVCVDVDWDMERTRGQCTLRSRCFSERKLKWGYPKHVLLFPSLVLYA